MWNAHRVEISLRYFSGEMRRAVDGLLSVVTFETALPPLKVVTVTDLATGVFLTALGVAFAVVEVLRVRLLRGVVEVAAGVDLTGIKTKFVCLPSYYKHKKTPVGVLCASLSSGLSFA